MRNFRYALARLMAGRYGHDALNITLVITALILSLISGFRFSGNQYVSFVGYVLLLLSFFRMFSRKIYKRRNENRIFLSWTLPIRKRFKLMRNNLSDKQRKYFLCPKCKRTVRIPRGRGKVEITCPSCRTAFNKRS